MGELAGQVSRMELQEQNGVLEFAGAPRSSVP